MWLFLKWIFIEAQAYLSPNFHDKLLRRHNFFCYDSVILMNSHSKGGYYGRQN